MTNCKYEICTTLAKKRTVQCVLLGDAGIGKTSLIVSYTTNGYPLQYTPTAFDKYSVDVLVDDLVVNLELCDTAGKNKHPKNFGALTPHAFQNEFDSLRILSYANAEVFLLCFSIASRRSFSRLQHMWWSELHNKTVRPLILVGTQEDLRTQASFGAQNFQDQPVSSAEARAFGAQMGAATYVECSALTKRNLKQVFDSALIAVLFDFNEKNVQHTIRRKIFAHTQSPGRRFKRTAGNGPKWRRKSDEKSIVGALSISPRRDRKIDCWSRNENFELEDQTFLEQRHRMHYENEPAESASNGNKIKTAWKKFVRFFS